MRRDIPQGVTVSTSFFQVGLFSHLPPSFTPPVWIRLVQEGKANLLFTSVCSHNGATCSPRVVIHGSTETQSYRLDVSRKSHTRGICGSALILIDVRVPFIALDVVYIERRFIEYLSIRQMKYCFPYPWRFSSWDFCGIF